eukprot:GHVS01065210.1.p1 GENE.GHVS01065210.1~~GHVS01065210.1.p1  ORF type:complete len:489 (+),score=57.62 GHVS01065210.1:110-1576(+)
MVWVQRYLGPDAADDKSEFLRTVLKLQHRQSGKVLKPDHRESTIVAPHGAGVGWNDMDKEQVLNLMKGANFYGLSREGPRAIMRDGDPVAFEVTLKVGEELEEKLGDVSTKKVLLQKIETVLERETAILTGLFKNRETAGAVYYPLQESTSCLEPDELDETTKLLKEIGSEMAKVPDVIEADVGEAAKVLADAFFENKEVALGFCLGLPVMAFKRPVQLGKEIVDVKIGNAIEEALRQEGNVLEKLKNFSDTGWVVVPLDMKRMDVSVDESGIPSYAVFRGNQAERMENVHLFDGVHCTLDSKKKEFSILQLMFTDLKYLEGPPNRYAKDVVAARYNVFISRDDWSKLDLSDDSASPDVRKTPLPFFSTSLSCPLISRDTAEIIVMSSEISSPREKWISCYKDIENINRYPVVFFPSLINKVIKIGDVRYKITEPKGEEIFTLVSETENNITIRRAYYTVGRYHFRTFIFNDGAEENSKGFAFSNRIH